MEDFWLRMVLASLPAGRRTVGCKWVFTVNDKANGTIERLEAKLVAKCFSWTCAVDYAGNLCTSCKRNPSRSLTLVQPIWMGVYRPDVKIAFLPVDLEEEIYMDIRPNISCQKTESGVCVLKAK